MRASARTSIRRSVRSYFIVLSHDKTAGPDLKRPRKGTQGKRSNRVRPPSSLLGLRPMPALFVLRLVRGAARHLLPPNKNSQGGKHTYNTTNCDRSEKQHISKIRSSSTHSLLVLRLLACWTSGRPKTRFGCSLDGVAPSEDTAVDYCDEARSPRPSIGAVDVASSCDTSMPPPNG